MNSKLRIPLCWKADNGKSYGTAQYAAGSSLSIPSYTFSSNGSYPLVARAVNLAEGGTCTTLSSPATLTVSNNPLALQILSLTAGNTASGVSLAWTAADDKNIRSYTVERGTDGISFLKAGEVHALGNGSNVNTYHFQDKQAVGTVWYRLQAIAYNGAATYSPVVMLRSSIAGNSVSISPVPFKEAMTISLETAQPTDVTLRLKDITGRVASERTYTLPSGSHSILFDNIGSISPGVYFFEVRENGKVTWIQRVQKS